MPAGKMKFVVFFGRKWEDGKVRSDIREAEWKYGIKLPVPATLSVDGTYRISGHTLAIEIEKDVQSYDFRFKGDRLILTHLPTERDQRREVAEYVRDDGERGAVRLSADSKEKGSPPAKGEQGAPGKVDDAKRILGRWRFPSDEWKNRPETSFKIIVEFKPAGKMKMSTVAGQGGSRPDNVAAIDGTYRIKEHTITMDLGGKTESGPFGFKDDHLILTFPPFGGERNWGFEYVRDDGKEVSKGASGEKKSP
jgi:hypothetical protein